MPHKVDADTFARALFYEHNRAKHGSITKPWDALSLKKQAHYRAIAKALSRDYVIAPISSLGYWAYIDKEEGRS